MTSEIAREEIEDVPEEHRLPHEVICNLLQDVDLVRFQWTDGGMLLMGVGGGPREDPLYTALRALLPGERDAQQVFQAIKADADYFLTTDVRSILRPHGSALRERVGAVGWAAL